MISTMDMKWSAYRFRVLFLMGALSAMPSMADDAAYAVIAAQPVHAIVAVPDPQDVVELYYDADSRAALQRPAGPGTDARKLSQWSASAAGLLIEEHIAPGPGYFWAVYEDGRSLLAGQRNLSATAHRNLRDLGGYATTDGRRVRPGLLFRSGQLNALQPDERHLLEGLGLRSLCDFRSQAEVTESPNPDLGSVIAVDGCQDATSADLTGQLNSLLELAERGDSVDWKAVMVRSYHGMGVRYEQQYRAFFAGLAAPDGLPMLFRCTGGKDRTGVAAALLLLALGVPEETVLRDYHLTEIDPVSGIESEVFPAAMLDQPALRAADPDYLRSALAGIRETYGSVDQYLDRLGVNAQMREALRERLLFPSPD